MCIGSRGQLATFQSTTVSLLSLEDPWEVDRVAVVEIVRNPRSNPDLALLLDYPKSGSGHDDDDRRRKWLSEAVRRWCRDACSLSPLHAALFTGNLGAAVQEASQAGRPWLAALLASSSSSSNGKTIQSVSTRSDEAEVVRLALNLLSGRLDGIARSYSPSHPALLGHALSLFYGGQAPSEPLMVPETTFPWNRPIPDLLDCLLSNRPPMVHPNAMPMFCTPGLPDLLVPCLVASNFGLPAAGCLQVAAAEQLLHLGFVGEAAQILPDPRFLLRLAALFPADGDGVLSQQQQHHRHHHHHPRLTAMAAAWRFHQQRDWEAEFDEWILAGNPAAAERVLLQTGHLADQYVLAGEHGRLAARLSAVSSGRRTLSSHLSIYRLYLQVRLEPDAKATAAADLLAALNRVAEPIALPTRIAFAEMTAACVSLLPATETVACRHLPPELALLRCHGILSVW